MTVKGKRCIFSSPPVKRVVAISIETVLRKCASTVFRYLGKLKDLRDYLADSKNSWCFGNRNGIRRHVFWFLVFRSLEPSGSPHFPPCLECRNVEIRYLEEAAELGDYLVDSNDFGRFGNKNGQSEQRIFYFSIFGRWNPLVHLISHLVSDFENQGYWMVSLTIHDRNHPIG